MKKKSFSRKRPIKKSYSVIVDGQTEMWYLQLASRYENFPRIDIKPELAKKKKLGEMFNLAIENAEVYDRVFWMIDLDIVLQNNQSDELEKYLLRIKNNKKVTVLINNPCLEFWYLLHFKATNRIFPNCKSVEKELRKTELLKDYVKTERYYKLYQNDIYLKLKKFQKEAIERAKKLGHVDFANLEKPKAEIYKIFDLLTNG